MTLTPLPDIEYSVPAGEVLVSKTDLNGRITFANADFVEVSGFTRDELLGSPHNIVRHPDMPREVFADLWQTIKANKPWHGMVKNRRKDGRYYWVEATVTPLFADGAAVGYVSFRHKASQEQIEQAAAAYRAISAGDTRLRIEEGRIVRASSRLLKWVGKADIRLRLLSFVTILMGTLIVLGFWGFGADDKTHVRDMEALAYTGLRAYALDSARDAEIDLQKQVDSWRNLLLRGHDATLLRQYAADFSQQVDVVHDRLERLKPIMQNLDLPVEPVEEAERLHLEMSSRYYQALQKYDIAKPNAHDLIDKMTRGASFPVVAQLQEIEELIRKRQIDELGKLNTTLEGEYRVEKEHLFFMLAGMLVFVVAIAFRFAHGILKPIKQAGSELDRVVRLQQQFFDAILRLEMYRDHVDEEQRIGNFIMARMTRIDDELASIIRHYTVPAEYLSGDILVAARTPADDIHILLADAVGHGLSAAINVLPLSQAFYDLTTKGYSIGQIATDLNKLVKNFMPVDRFVSVVLVSISRQDRVIEVWNGGVPPLRLFGRDGRLLHSWEPRHLPCGILPAGDFSARTEAFRYEGDCQLCLFSDGLLDAMSPQGMQFGEQHITEVFSGTPHESRFEALVAELQSHLQGRSAHDDISFALIDISAELPEELCCCELEAQKTGALGDDWRIVFSLGASELKYLDVVPLLTQIIGKIHVAGEHHSALFLVLSELFNNALDHGILQLDSKIKLGSEGFEKYLELRDERINALSNAKIEIEIEKVLLEDRTGIKIRIADSGDGFDYAAVMAATAEQPSGIQHGRGIALTRSLVYKLEYAGKGNEVTAYYICG